MIYTPKPISGNVGSFKVGGKIFGVDKGLKLSELEEFYFANNENELKKYSNNILQDILSDEKDLSKDYHKLGQEIEFVEFVLYKILKKNKSEKKKVRIFHAQRKDSCLINKIFNQNCFVWEGKIYSLSKGKRGVFSARINNETYSIGESYTFNLKELEEDYLSQIADKLCDQLTKGQESLLCKIKRLKEQKDVIKLVKKGEFLDSEENIGFKKDGECFFVTTKVKSFILYEPQNDKYYRFGEALIGVGLVKRDGKLEWQDPMVINSYIHPALPSAIRLPHQKICNGKFDYNKCVRGKSLDDAIRTLLVQATRMIEMGYYGERGAWHFLTEPEFQNLEIKHYDPKEVTNK